MFKTRCKLNGSYDTGSSKGSNCLKLSLHVSSLSFFSLFLSNHFFPSERYRSGPCLVQWTQIGNRNGLLKEVEDEGKPFLHHSSSALTKDLVLQSHTWHSVAISVTRFDEISPLWQKMKMSCNLMRVYLVFGTNGYLLRQLLYTIGQFFMAVNGKIMKTLKAICGQSYKTHYDRKLRR